MYVCICRGVTEREIRSCVDEGARSLRDLRECLGVSSECGRCARDARAILREATGDVPQSPLMNSPLAA